MIVVFETALFWGSLLALTLSLVVTVIEALRRTPYRRRGVRPTGVGIGLAGLGFMGAGFLAGAEAPRIVGGFVLIVIGAGVELRNAALRA